MNNFEIKHAKPVTVSLKDLKSGNVPFSILEEAFGPDSLGILVVKDLPQSFPSLRKNLLSYASYLANLPQDHLEKLELPEAKWLVGWSCGREKLKDGQFDRLKGSYYVNCSPSFAETIVQGKLIEKYPSFPEYTASNIWPSETLLPGFSTAFVALCTLIIDVASLVARSCDQYAESKVAGYQKGYLEHIVRTSHVSKARLLHYFPAPDGVFGDHSDDNWCATHKDHGALTGLTSAMFVDEGSNPPKIEDQFIPIPELDTSPDPKAGLYIQSRSGEIVKVSVPKDCLAFQTGETLEVITKGKFKAVPHFVKGPAPGLGGKIARNTLALFTQPNLWEKVDDQKDFATFAREIVEKNH